MAVPTSERLAAAARAALGSRRSEEIAEALAERARQIDLVEATDPRAWLERPPAEPPAGRPHRNVDLAPPSWSRLGDCLDRIDEALHAWATVAPQGGDGDGTRPVVGVKDVIHVRDVPTRAGTASEVIGPDSDDAAAVAALRATGAPLVGKTLPTPWALNDPAGTVNPRDPDRTPGGSSAGSAVAVSTGMCDATIDTQTAGDVLRPAAFNGVVGFKPSAGWIGIAGTVQVARSIDTIGVTARDVASAAAVVALVRDSAAAGPRASRLAWPPRLLVVEWGRQRADTTTRAAFDSAVRDLAAAGAEVTPGTAVQVGVDLDAVHAAHRIVTFTECASYHAGQGRTDPERFPARARLILDLGATTPPSAYRAAQDLRGTARTALDALLNGWDVALLPTTTSAAPARDTTGDNSLQIPWTFCGLPAISLPIGLDPEGQPLSVQLVAATGSDDQLVAVARWCEAVLDTSLLPPPGGPRGERTMRSQRSSQPAAAKDRTHG